MAHAALASKFIRLAKISFSALAIFCAIGEAGAAPEKNTFVIDDAEGYGITDCLSGGQACGKVVADAWCEAHGMGPAVAFGNAADLTSSIDGAATPAQTPVAPAAKSAQRPKSNALIVRCAE